MKYYAHPAYVGHMNTLDKKDRRHKEYEEQYNKQGFDDSVTWSLDYSMLVWIRPRLKRFYEIDIKITERNEFQKELKKIIKILDYLLEGGVYNDMSEETEKNSKKFWSWIAKNHRSLWW